MSKLFKSKILLGVMMLGLVFGGFAVSKASAADCSITMSLSMGMRNSEVTCLQSTLGVSPATGYFGSKTKAAVVAWQAANGLPSTGLFGSMSRAKLAGGSTVATTSGCAAGAMFNSTTGAPCSTSTSTVAGCAAGAMFSSTTGASCSGTTSTVVSGTNGYLADIASDSTNRVSTVYESETDKVVAGFRATARLSSQNVNRVRVTFVNTNTGSSANLGKYITSASLWNGSTKLATMSVADADRATSSDIYTFNFAGLNAPIAKDTIGRFYVSVNANGSLDSTDATNANWTVSFTAGGVSASSPDGSYDTYPTNAIDQTGLTFGKFVSNGIKATVNLSSSNPSASTIAVSNTSTTSGQTLLKFTIKATNTDLNLRKVPIQVTTTGANGSALINTLKLYRDSTMIDSVDGANGYVITSTTITSTSTAAATSTGYIFSNLSSQTITAGSTVEFSVVADLKSKTAGSYSDGASILAALTNADVLLASNFSVQDQNGDQLTNASSSIRIGSAVGNVQTLRENGVNVVMGSTSIAYSAGAQGVFDQATYTIPLTVTSFGNTVYVGQSMQVVGTNSTISSTNAFGFAFQKSSAPTTDVVSGVTYTATLSSSDATLESGTGFRLDNSGTAKHFTVQVTIYGGNTAASYRVALDHAQTFTNAALSTGSAISSLLPAESFRTGYQLITK